MNTKAEQLAWKIRGMWEGRHDGEKASANEGGGEQEARKGRCGGRLEKAA